MTHAHSTTTPPLDVLVVDDEKNIRSTLRVCLEGLGCARRRGGERPRPRSDGERAAAASISPFWTCGSARATASLLIPPLLASSPLIDIVVVTAYGTVENAVEAIQLGARDVLPKPFTPEQIRTVVDKVRARRVARAAAGRAAPRARAAPAPSIELESRSPKVRQLLGVLAKAAAHDVSVLLRGENGTGKSVLARQLHALSARDATARSSW